MYYTVIRGKSIRKEDDRIKLSYYQKTPKTCELFIEELNDNLDVKE